VIFFSSRFIYLWVTYKLVRNQDDYLAIYNTLFSDAHRKGGVLLVELLLLGSFGPDSSSKCHNLLTHKLPSVIPDSWFRSIAFLCYRFAADGSLNATRSKIVSN